MSAARSVTATFSGGSSAQVALTVAVTGHGTVTGGGITCGNGRGRLHGSVSDRAATVGLTATPRERRDVRRLGRGLQRQDADLHGGDGRGEAGDRRLHRRLRARATGSAGAAQPRPTGGLAYSGRLPGHAPLPHERAGQGAHAGAARRHGFRRRSRSPPQPGPATVGPFPVAKPGFYTFDLRLGAPHPALDGLSRPLRRAGGVEPVHAHPRAARGRRRGHALVGHPALPLVAAGRRRRPGRTAAGCSPGRCASRSGSERRLPGRSCSPRGATGSGSWRPTRMDEFGP